MSSGWQANLLTGLGFAGLGVVGMLSAAPGHNESPIWPAAGVAVAAVWLRGTSIVPGLLIGAFLACWLGPGARSFCCGDGFHPSALGPTGALIAACGNVVAACAAGRLLRSPRFRVRLDGVAGMLRLWLACLVYAVISGSVGAGVVVAATPAPFTDWPMIAMTWGSGDLIGALVVAPLIRLTAMGVPRPAGRGEALAIAAVLALATVLGIGLPEGADHIPLSFIVFPPLLWAALRLPPLWSALAVAAVSASAFASAVAGLGPFSDFATRFTDQLGLQAYIASAAMAVHLLAVVTAERERAMSDLRASEERFRLLGESSGDLVCLHRLDGRITWVSPSALALLGRRPEDLVTAGPWELIHPDDRDRVRAGFRPRRLAGSHQRQRLRARRADGGWTWLETSASLVRGGDGLPVAVQTASRDITAQVQHEAELAQARATAEAATRVKATFLAAMSHEIRTPLNGVIGMAELLAEQPLPPDAHEAARIIRRSGETLLTILNDILDFSKIEAGRLELETLAVDPGAIAAEVGALFAHGAADKGLILRIDRVADAPRVLFADPARLRQVLANLVSNAVKFTRRGSVTVRIGRAAATALAPHGRLALAVVDTGMGIPGEALGRLFREFSQVDAGTARRHGGTGLGLAISRRLVEAMGGAIVAESVPGQGSTFTVLLPLPDPAIAPALPSRLTPDEAPAVRPGLRVLLAEDDAISQLVALSLLRRLGAEATVAADGAAAILTWEGGGIDLVLMDMQMPGIDGLEAARAIRASERARGLPRTPIIALTANAFPEDRTACLAAGMDDIIAKPVTIACLATLLARHGVRQA